MFHCSLCNIHLLFRNERLFRRCICGKPKYFQARSIVFLASIRKKIKGFAYMINSAVILSLPHFSLIYFLFIVDHLNGNRSKREICSKMGYKQTQHGKWLNKIICLARIFVVINIYFYEHRSIQPINTHEIQQVMDVGSWEK